jgi:TRAP-type C4-dicarboxylate transport system permease small subunit
MSAYSKVLSATRWVASAWVIACFNIMTIAVLAQVGGRYFFNYSIASSAEIATLAQIWMVLVGAGVAAREDIHARIDALVNKFPLPARRVLTLGAAVLGVVFLLSIVVGAIPMMENGRYQTTPILGLPMWIPYLGLVIGPLYFAVEVVDTAVRQWHGEIRVHGELEPGEVTEAA